MLLYRFLITCAAPVLAILLFVRVLRRQERMQDFLERMGFWRSLPSGEVIWLHGASNGELTSARKLIEALRQRFPEAALVLSCNSASAKQMMLEWGIENTHIRLAPLDLRWIYHRFFTRMRVQKFIVLEADFWPNRLRAAQRRAIPIALVAGRMSAKSLRTWARFQKLSAAMFGAFDLICPQDATSLARLSQLGARSNAIGPEISLKSLFESPQVLRDHAARSEFWLAASTHEGEDEIVLNAHKMVQAKAPKLRLILAPRHPKRGSQIAQQARALGLSVTQRSKNDPLATQSDVYIADTLGEMETWYAAAATCFVAGSLVAKGGHTPFEPMSFDCAILHGPNVENFADAYMALQKHGGARQCLDHKDMSEAVLTYLDPKTAKHACLNARKALAQSGSLNPVLDALSQMSKI